jgi:TonB family protein
LKLAFSLLAIAVLAPGVAFGADANLQREAADLFAHAAARQDIRTSGDKPYILHARFNTEHIIPKPAEGQYQEVWLSPDKWRSDLVLAAFKQVEIGGAEAKSVSRNIDFRPRPAYLLAVALDAFIYPNRLDVEKVVAIHGKKIKGSERRCAELVADNETSKDELCFDASGALVSEERLSQRFEYENFGSFGNKIFPKSIRVYEEGRKVLDISVDDLVSPIEMKPELFQAASSAQQLAPCERWPAIPTRKETPHYPQPARNAHQEGTVVAYAVVGADGRFEKTKVLNSAGEALDQATLAAVQQWIYPPVSCGSRPLPTEIEIRVNYQLRYE